MIKKQLFKQTDSELGSPMVPKSVSFDIADESVPVVVKEKRKYTARKPKEPKEPKIVIIKEKSSNSDDDASSNIGDGNIGDGNICDVSVNNDLLNIMQNNITAHIDNIYKDLQKQLQNITDLINAQQLPPRENIQPKIKNELTLSNNGNKTLADLLTKCTTSSSTSSSIKPNALASNDAAYFNDFFQTIYILNETDKGVALATQLVEMGINSDLIAIIYTEFPDKNKYTPQYKYLHFLKDAIENAMEVSCENPKPILILSDTVSIRNMLLFEFNTACENLLELDCDIIQFGFRKVHKLKRSNIDPKYYMASYPGANFKSEEDANRHWIKLGFVEGRLGLQNMVIYDDDTCPSDSFAFSVKFDTLSCIQEKIEYLIKTMSSTAINVNCSIFEGLINKRICNFYPNLFIQKTINLKSNVGAKYVWHLPSYT